MSPFLPGQHVYCPAWGYGTVTMHTDDDKIMFVKFHSEGVPEMVYHSNGKWREVTEDSHYDLVHVSRYQKLLNKYLEVSMYGIIGYLLGLASFSFIWR